MAELLVIVVLGGALAWLRAHSDAPERTDAAGSTWDRWEAELQDTTRF